MIIVFVVLELLGCDRGARAEALRKKAPGQTAGTRAVPAATPPGARMKDHVVGAPQDFDGLSIFPIFANRDVDVGPMTTLDRAIAARKAEVREIGAKEGRSGENAVGDAPGGGFAQVNKLVIENKGDVPIYVLAGTVVKGGNQDRQIGQDFVIDPRKVAAVDAFCVEQGRWNGARDGRATGGRFGTSQQLVSGSVRAAAQYEKNQGEVWARVAKVNATHQKSAASGTLLATLDDTEIQQKKAALASKIEAFLGSVQPPEKVVGFAFALDGQVKAVRWFASHGVFELFRKTLVDTAALDALTAHAARGDGESRAPTPSPSAVVAFVEQVEKGAAEERDTAAANANQYKVSSSGYGSKTFRKASRATPAPASPISVDYLAK